MHHAQNSLRSLPCRHLLLLLLGKTPFCSQIPLPPVTFPLSYLGLTLSVTQPAFAPTSDRLLCACVGLIGPHPSDYAHALSACFYFLQAVFLPALGLWSSLAARRVSHDTSYSFLTFSVFLNIERIDESYIKAPTATSNCRLTTSEDAWGFLGDKADMPLAYRVKVHKCAGLVAAL